MAAVGTLRSTPSRTRRLPLRLTPHGGTSPSYRTYADPGRSGLRIDGRDGLQNLIRDVQLGRVDFDCDGNKARPKRRSAAHGAERSKIEEGAQQ